MKKLFGTLLAVTFTIFYHPYRVHAQLKPKPVIVSVKASPDSSYETSLALRDRKLAKKILKSKEKKSSSAMPLTDVTLTVGKRRYSLDRKGNVYDLDRKMQVLLPVSDEKQLLRFAGKARKKHYGALVPWAKVDEWLPRKSVFTVIDLETGKTFDVQRRAGSAHADVQPLTRADTKIMKAIYGGKWSWRRRAILVKTHGRRIAASMHGMPHGAGALANGFPGHFCIHFHESTTHRTKRVDPSHEIMIYKAAGKVDDFLERASPYEVANAFFVAVNNKDGHLLNNLLDRSQPEPVKQLSGLLDSIDAIKPFSQIEEADKENALFLLKLPVDARIYEDGRKKSRKTLKFILFRNAPGEKWLIDTQTLLESLES